MSRLRSLFASTEETRPPGLPPAPTAGVERIARSPQGASMIERLARIEEIIERQAAYNEHYRHVLAEIAGGADDAGDLAHEALLWSPHEPQADR